MKRLNINKIVKRCALVALVGLMSGCVTNSVTDDQELCPKSTLTFNFSIPENTVTRVDKTGQDDGIVGESTIRNLKVWIFATDGTSVGYGTIADATSQQASDNTLRLKVEIPTKYSSATCDIYALANSDAVTTTTALDATTTRDALVGMTFTTAPTDLTKGLPMARIATGINIANFVNTDTPVEMSLLRSVSKIGFYFTKQSTELDNVNITIDNIEVKDGIATGTGNLFPAAVELGLAKGYPSACNVPASTSGFTSGDLNYSLPTGGLVISAGSTSSLQWLATETGTQFKQKLTEHTSYAAESYLLESNKAASCMVTYTIGGTQKTSTFALWTENPGLIRNHEVVVYGYFKGGNLYVQPSVQPWVDGGTVTYNTSDVEADVTAGDANKVGSEGTLVAYDENDVNHNGQYYPKFTVTLTKPIVSRWLLQSSNPNFGFKLNLTDDVKDFIEGVGGSSNSVTFYVVPKNKYSTGSDQTVYSTTLFLTVPDLPVLGRLVFNHHKDTIPGPALDATSNNSDGVTIVQVAPDSY